MVPWSNQSRRSSGAAPGCHPAACSPASSPGGKFAGESEQNLQLRTPHQHLILCSLLHKENAFAFTWLLFSP